jgi:hypothetical protein
MGQGRRLCALAAVPFLALSLAAQNTGGADAAATEPSVKVAAHWSRWSYPTELAPAAGQQVHTVVKGDTLWDLGAKYLGNPFAWPQIWELNKWIKDPHWIYPGDPILIEKGRGVVPQDQMAPGEVANLKPDVHRGAKPAQDEYGFTFQDFLQMPYLVPGTAEAYLKSIGAFKVVGQEDQTKNLMADGDYLYIGGGANQGVKAGDRLVITGVEKPKFYHPDDLRHQHLMGAILEQHGVVRVTKVYPDQSVAVIERSLDGISANTFVAPFTDPPTLPARLRRDIGNPVAIKDPAAKVIFIRLDKAVAAGGDLVIIDRGANEGFKVGDVLLSARQRPLVTAHPDPKAETTYYLGQLMVIRADARTSTCRILRSTSEIQVGDLLTH